MKVTVWKNVDVECQCDVEFGDMLLEFVNQVELGETMPRLLMSSLDCITKTLARVEDAWIANMKPGHQEEMLRRLTAEVQRYAAAVGTRTAASVDEKPEPGNSDS